MYASRDRKSAKEGKRPLKLPETNLRANPNNNRAGSASHNQSS
jgi:hypothetical protein